MQRRLLQVLVLSVAICAILGVVFLLTGSFGEFEIRVLVTGLLIAGATMPAMACAGALGRGRAPVLGRLGLASAALGFGMLVAAVWRDGASDTYFKVALSAVIGSYGAAHVSALSLADLGPRLRWVLGVAVASSAALATMLIYMMWGSGWDNEWFARLLGAVAIAAAGSSLLVGLLHRLT
jgi:hypothetical protein